MCITGRLFLLTGCDFLLQREINVLLTLSQILVFFFAILIDTKYNLCRLLLRPSIKNRFHPTIEITLSCLVDVKSYNQPKDTAVNKLKSLSLIVPYSESRSH